MEIQRTIREQIQCTGVGLHSGQPVTMTLLPAVADQGIVFIRADLPERPEIPARLENVSCSVLATTLATGKVSVGTVEHILAALSGSGVDNLTIEVNGPELPIMDGSAAPFLLMINAVGTKPLGRSRQFIRIKKPIRVSQGDRTIEIKPSESTKVSCSIEFDHPLLQNQEMSVDLNPSDFGLEISRARTFGFLDDAEALRRAGLAQGGNLDNVIVIDRFKVLNAGGLRFEDEFVRHKILDMIGDLSLLGKPILGHVSAYKTGHSLNHQMVREIQASPDCWELVCPGQDTEPAFSTPAVSRLEGMPESAVA